MSDDLSKAKVGDWVVLHLLPEWAEQYGAILAGPIVEKSPLGGNRWHMKVVTSGGIYAHTRGFDFFIPDPSWFSHIQLIPMEVRDE